MIIITTPISTTPMSTNLISLGIFSKFPLAGKTTLSLHVYYTLLELGVPERILFTLDSDAIPRFYQTDNQKLPVPKYRIVRKILDKLHEKRMLVIFSSNAGTWTLRQFARILTETCYLDLGPDWTGHHSAREVNRRATVEPGLVGFSSSIGHQTPDLKFLQKWNTNDIEIPRNTAVYRARSNIGNLVTQAVTALAPHLEVLGHPIDAKEITPELLSRIRVTADATARALRDENGDLIAPFPGREQMLAIINETLDEHFSSH